MTIDPIGKPYIPPGPRPNKPYTIKQGDPLQNILTNKLGFSSKEATTSIRYLSSKGFNPDKIRPGQIVSSYNHELYGKRAAIHPGHE